MNEGDIVLAAIPQADDATKPRPVLLIRTLPPFGDYLACGISTQLRHAVPEFDEILLRSDSDFEESGLLSESVIRLGFLAVLPRHKVMGTFSAISPERHHRLITNLTRHLEAGLRSP